MKVTEQQINRKFLDHFLTLRSKIEEDKLIYGDAYVHFTERGIEVVDPKKVQLKIVEEQSSMTQEAND